MDLPKVHDSLLVAFDLTFARADFAKIAQNGDSGGLLERLARRNQLIDVPPRLFLLLRQRDQLLLTGYRSCVIAGADLPGSALLCGALAGVAARRA